MKPKALIISPSPYPLNSGGKQAMFHMINQLRDDVDFTLFILVNGKEEKEKLPELKRMWINVTIIPFFHKTRDFEISIIMKLVLNRY